MPSLENQIYEKNLKADWSKSFKCAGFYGTYINDRLVYVGKSKNILRRMAQHWADITVPQGKEHKYQVLAEAKNKGHKIRFLRLYEAKSSSEQELIEELGSKEGQYIRAKLPPLNTQIPCEDDWRSYTTNNSASTVSLYDILTSG